MSASRGETAKVIRQAVVFHLEPLAKAAAGFRIHASGPRAEQVIGKLRPGGAELQGSRMQPWRISAGLTAAIAGAALVLAEDRVGYLAPLWPVILADHGISIAVNLALVLATVAAAIYIVARVSPGAWISPSAPSGGARGIPRSPASSSRKAASSRASSPRR